MESGKGDQIPESYGMDYVGTDSNGEIWFEWGEMRTEAAGRAEEPEPEEIFQPALKRIRVEPDSYCAKPEYFSFPRALLGAKMSPDILEKNIGQLFVDRFLVRNQFRKSSYQQKTFNHRLGYLFRKDPAVLPFAWIVMAVHGLASVSEVTEATISVWNAQKAEPNSFALFPAKEAFTAFISLCWLVKAAIFLPDFTPTLTEVKKSNPQYPRTIFMVPRYDRNMLIIVQKSKGPLVQPKLLYAFSWDDYPRGTFRVQKIAVSVPPILNGLDHLDGSDGRDIYNQVFKGHVVQDYNV